MAKVDPPEFRTAAEVCAAFTLPPEGRRLLREGLTPPEFFDLLVAGEHYPSAVRFLAHALPKRAAVWWGCLCLWHGHRPNPADKEAAVLKAVVRWVLDPGDENRRAAEAPARAVPVGTAAGSLGMAVFWSGGSMLAPHLPVLPPKPFLTARAAAGSVLLAAAGGGSFPDRQRLRREFLTIGRQVAERRVLWVPAAAAPTTNGVGSVLPPVLTVPGVEVVS
jgi:hypothetical protein